MRQAVRASDYSFVEFRFLKRLVAVHGRYSYLRLRQLVLYSFYKNIAFIMVIFWWGWWRYADGGEPGRTAHRRWLTATVSRRGRTTEPTSAWSGQSIYNDTILSMVNVLYLSLPPLAQGIFEKDISEAAIYREPRVHWARGAVHQRCAPWLTLTFEPCRPCLRPWPQLYREVQGNIYFNRRALLAWIAPAVYECIILYFILFLAFDDTGVIDFRYVRDARHARTHTNSLKGPRPERLGGPPIDRRQPRTMSLYYSTIALAVVLIKSLLTTRQITWVNWAAVGLSYGVYLATIFALGIAFPYTGACGAARTVRRVPKARLMPRSDVDVLPRSLWQARRWRCSPTPAFTFCLCSPSWWR